MLTSMHVHAASWYDLGDKPWPARYVLSVAPDYSGIEKYAPKTNEEDRKKGDSTFWSFEEFFDATHSFRGTTHPTGFVYEDMYASYEDFGYQVINFDKNRQGAYAQPHAQTIANQANAH